jgi:XTP/dITP diphosphohydrolase
LERTIVLATHNRDKVRELAALFIDLPVEHIVCAADLEGAPQVDEDGATLEANALKKARALAAHTGLLCLADDTGLEVDALDGAPGVYAARYAGPGATYADNCRKLLNALDGVADERRTARFRTVIALVDPVSDESKFERTVEGVLEGRILAEPHGDGGFGYDPVFLVPELGRTLAELDLAQKNAISHRARASRAMVEVLGAYLASLGE